jgi:hypothetical protein
MPDLCCLCPMSASAKFEEAIKDDLAELEDSRLITTKNKDAFIYTIIEMMPTNLPTHRRVACP